MVAAAAKLKKFLLILLKVSVSLGIVAYLVWDAAGTRNEEGENVFEQLLGQPKNWGLLGAAWILCASGVTLTLIRWWYLVRALELPLGFKDALRIGFLGYLFNLAPMGIVGGDLLKAVMLARANERRLRVRAVASVVVDRMIGLYVLFVVATAAILLTGVWKLPNPDVRIICRVTFLLTAVGAVGIAVLLTPGFTDGRGTRALSRLPKIGKPIDHLIDAVRMYRRKPHVLIIASLMSVGVHSLFTVGIFLIACGLFGSENVLSLATHFVVSPLSASTGAVPLPMGPFEFVLEFLYTHVPEQGVEIAKGQGLIVALSYRLIGLLIAAVGIGYYFGSRREVAEVMHEAEREQEAGETDA